MHPLNIQIVQETFAVADDPFDDFIIFRYTIENQNDDPLLNFYFSLFFDWDLDGSSYATNMIDYYESEQLGYVYDTSDTGPTMHAGVSLLSHDNATHRAIINDNNDPPNPSWGIYDGFTDIEKWQAISTHDLNQAGPADVSQAFGAGPFTISPNKTIQIAFALIGGDSLTDLINNARSAKQFWNENLQTAVQPIKPKTPTTLNLQQNYPNPFNPSTIINYQLPLDSKVELSILNSTGQLVKTLQSGMMLAGPHSAVWDGTDHHTQPVSSGLYFYQLKTRNLVLTKKMLLLH